MTPSLALILGASCIAAAIGIGATDLIRSRAARLLVSAALIAAGIAVYVVNVSPGIESKGGARETVAVVCCYASMLLGMVAQYFYRQAESGAKRLRFRAIEFLMPIFASPIVFIPLLTISSDATMSG